MTDVRSICNLDDQAFEARQKELREGLFRQIRGREELSDGRDGKGFASAENQREVRQWLNTLYQLREKEEIEEALSSQEDESPDGVLNIVA